jgi:hypothetical protein
MLSIISEAADFNAADLRNGRKIGGFLSRRAVRLDLAPAGGCGGVCSLYNLLRVFE